jgi:hydroxyacylglutathione hydrolase
VGWILPVGTPLVLVLPDTRDAATEAVDQLVRIGFDRIVGVLDGGIERWVADGRPVIEITTMTAAAVADELRSGSRPAIVDVRDEGEMREDGRLDDAFEIPLAGLIDGDPPTLAPGSEVTVACKSGARATVAAGLLEARGHRVRLVPRGGIQDVVRDLTPRGPTPA